MNDLKTYADDRGRRYIAKSYDLHGGIGTKWKIFFQKQDSVGWVPVPGSKWRDTRKEAVADLEAFAEKRGWRECEE